MLVKICGITTMDAAHRAAESGADFIGFVFAKSKRQISPENAAIISAVLPAAIKKVGVFVNETPDTIIEIASQVGLDYIQLHGNEPSELARQLPYPVIKAFHVTAGSAELIKAYPCDYYLLDSPIGANLGGNGTAFDWNLLAKIKIDREKIILAGGLRPENVQKAITIANPAGVDVSSGVETNGKKNLSKIKQFIFNAKKKG